MYGVWYLNWIKKYMEKVVFIKRGERLAQCVHDNDNGQQTPVAQASQICKPQE